MQTEQIKFWKGAFGKEYTDRNTYTHAQWQQSHIDKYGETKVEMNERMIGFLPRDARILEIGCNTGQQLEGLQNMGFTNLFGIELQWYAVERSKQLLEQVNILQGSGFDIPFKDDYFDLVFTSGVLIHIAPQDLSAFMSEMIRVSRRYIYGFEYFSEDISNINYRGNKGFLWKADYPKLFQDCAPNVREVKREIVPYISAAEKNNEDILYLIEKT